MTEIHPNGHVELVAPAVFRLRTLMVNAYFIVDSSAERSTWTLVDAGLPGYSGTIRREAGRLFGARAPAAILLTHGHIDHIGGLPQLADGWGVPIYVHPLELPYVTGVQAYPPPNPKNGGMMAWTSPLLPRGPFDLGARVHMLPEDGVVPTLPGWQWIATPGHTAGHVSFFRESDRVLIAGDAVVTTKQEYGIDVMTQRPAVWRPPAYFTSDWDSAWASIRVLAALDPEVLATGHGAALRGPDMRDALHHLANRFDEVIPDGGIEWTPVALGAAAIAAAVVAVTIRSRGVRRRSAVARRYTPQPNGLE